MATEFDIDGEKMMFQGKMRSADDLKQRIKTKVEEGDFDVSEESEALKELNEYLVSLTEFKLKLTQDMLEALEKVSKKSDVTIGETIRRALADHIQ